MDLQIGYSLLERRIEGNLWMPATHWVSRLRPMACSLAAYWVVTSTPICRLKVTTSALGFRERTCGASSTRASDTGSALEGISAADVARRKMNETWPPARR